MQVCSARTVEEGDHILPGSINGVVKRIKDAGGEAIAVKCDLSEREDRDALIEATRDAYGPVDILVNNAAITYFIPVDDFPEKFPGKPKEDELKGNALAAHVGKRARKGKKVEGFPKAMRVVAA